MAFTVTKKYGEQELDDGDAVEVYTVISDTANPGLRAARTAQGTNGINVPGKGQSYQGDYFLQADTMPVRQLTDFLFEVTVNYRLIDGGGGGGGEDNDPLNQPVQITYATVLYQEMMDEDAKGNIVQTVNDEPFDPGLAVDKADIAVTFTKNFATFSLASMSKFQNKCNADDWYGFIPYTCRVIGISGEDVRGPNNDLLYYRVSVTIQIREAEEKDGTIIGWLKKIKHQGFLVFDGDEYVNAMDDSKPPQPETEPVPLDETGRRVAKGELPFFIYFAPYKTATFNSMNLGV